LKQSTLANLANISVKPLNAIKKPFEARVTLLSRYSFPLEVHPSMNGKKELADIELRHLKMQN
jgi:hypothetical protein